MKAKRTKSEVRTEMLEALTAPIPRPKTPLAYRAGILAVAVVLVLLPVVYVALIAAIGYGVFWHATENTTVISNRRGFWLYAAPIVIGAVLVFFMLKPLLARRRYSDNRVELDPDDEPYLFEFVDRLCQAVGADSPRRILIDCDINASAGFHHGGTGIATTGRELTIGLPLVAGMSARQLAGVLAHEFGHFAQGAGMRLGFTVNRINNWFARVVFQRDSWDEQLQKWSKTGWGYAGVVAQLARGLVWLTRRILFGLMWIARAASSYSSRQMEYDADHFEISLAGSKAFTQSMHALSILNAGRSVTDHMLDRGRQEGRLPDNLPQLYAKAAAELPDEARARIVAQIEQDTAHLFATHPRAADRIRAAMAADSAGTFEVRAPASILFDDFIAASTRVTVAHYESIFGRAPKAEHLVSASRVLEEHAADALRGEAMQRYFAGTASPYRSIAMSTEVRQPPELDAARDELEDIRRSIKAGVGEYASNLDSFVRTHATLAAHDTARASIAAGKRGNADDAQAQRKACAIEVERLDRAMQPFENLVARRLELCLAMVDTEGIRESITNTPSDAARFVAAERALRTVLPRLVHVRRSLDIVKYLSGAVDENAPDPKLTRAINTEAEQLRARMTEIRENFDDTPYPFDNADGETTVGDFLLPIVPSRRNLARLCGAAQSLCADATGLDYRLRCHLAEIGEQVEGSLGLAIDTAG